LKKNQKLPDISEVLLEYCMDGCATSTGPLSTTLTKLFLDIINNLAYIYKPCVIPIFAFYVYRNDVRAFTKCYHFNIWLQYLPNDYFVIADNA
jgi:hypothetical protein